VGVSSFGPATAEDNLGGLAPQQIAQIGTQRSQQLIASQDGMVMLSQKTGGLFVHGNNDIPVPWRKSSTMATGIT
jgi:hypothetical protein